MDPEALEALRRIFEAQKSEIRVSLFARITRVDISDPHTPLIDCQAVVKETIESPEGARDLEALPEFFEVPVMYQMGAPGFSITFPVAVGGIVHLSIGMQDFSQWFLTNQPGASEPDEFRPHALDNAVAYPVGYAKGHGPEVVLGTMVIAATQIHFGIPHAALHLAIGELCNNEFQRLVANFDTHTHTSAVSGSPTSGPMDGVTPMVLSPAANVNSGKLFTDG